MIYAKRVLMVPPTVLPPVMQRRAEGNGDVPLCPNTVPPSTPAFQPPRTPVSHLHAMEEHHSMPMFTPGVPVEHAMDGQPAASLEVSDVRRSVLSQISQGGDTPISSFLQAPLGPASALVGPWARDEWQCEVCSHHHVPEAERKKVAGHAG